MWDITKCNGENCDGREDCVRYILHKEYHGQEPGWYLLVKGHYGKDGCELKIRKDDSNDRK